MATIGAFAQPAAGTFSITPKVGVNAATITNDKENTDESYRNGVFQLTVGYKINL